MTPREKRTSPIPSSSRKPTVETALTAMYTASPEAPAPAPDGRRCERARTPRQDDDARIARTGARHAPGGGWSRLSRAVRRVVADGLGRSADGKVSIRRGSTPARGRVARGGTRSRARRRGAGKTRCPVRRMSAASPMAALRRRRGREPRGAAEDGADGVRHLGAGGGVGGDGVERALDPLVVEASRIMPDQVVAVDPRDHLLAVAHRPAGEELEGEDHLVERAPALAQHHADADLDGPHPVQLDAAGGLLPARDHVGEEALAVLRGLVELLVRAARAVEADGRGATSTWACAWTCRWRRRAGGSRRPGS